MVTARTVARTGGYPAAACCETLAPVSLALSMPGSRQYSTSESFPHQRVDAHSYARLAAIPPDRE